MEYLATIVVEAMVATDLWCSPVAGGNDGSASARPSAGVLELRCCGGLIGRAGSLSVTKTIFSWQKHSPTRDFYASTLPPTSLDLDRWGQREGYGRSNIGEKHFQLFSIFIV